MIPASALPSFIAYPLILAFILPLGCSVPPQRQPPETDTNAQWWAKEHDRRAQALREEQERNREGHRLAAEKYKAGETERLHIAKEDYIAARPSMQSRITKSIRNGEAALGMTTNDAFMVWGHPRQVSRYGDKTGIGETWDYGSTTIYFRNGELTSWHQTGR